MPNRFTGEEHRLSRAELAALCALTVANETQIAASPEFRLQYRAVLAELFGCMRGLVEEEGLAEALAVLGHA